MRTAISVRSMASSTYSWISLSRVLVLAGLACPAYGQALLWKVEPSPTFGFVGREIVALGDVDGDGAPDIAVFGGTPGSATFQGAGQIFSSATGLPVTTLAVSGAPSYGSVAARAGDFDQDGVEDVLVGNAGESSILANSVVVNSGATGAILHGFTAPSGLGMESFGSAVAAAGDVDADGFVDIAIGAPLAIAAPLQGKVLLYSGATGALLAEKAGSTQTAKRVVGVGDLDQDGFADVVANSGAIVTTLNVVRGGSFSVDKHGIVGAVGSANIEALGDVDQDGSPDFVVGAKNLFVLSGNGLLPLVTVTLAYDANAGSSLAAMGDQDGDGIADFAAWANAGGAVNSDLKHVSIYSGATGLRLVAMPSTGSFGAQLDSIGDLDGDGRRDLLVTKPGVDASSGLALAYSSAQIECGACEATGESCSTLAGIDSVLSIDGCVMGGGLFSLRVSCEQALQNSVVFVVLGTQPAALPAPGFTCRIIPGPAPSFVGPLPVSLGAATEFSLESLLPPTLPSAQSVVVQVIHANATTPATFFTNGVIVTTP